MKRCLPIIAILALLPALVGARTRESFNAGWQFLKGDAKGAEKADFDSSLWRTLNLPHDWAIEGPFDVKYNARCGGLPFHGTGWYRKDFTLPASAKNQRVTIEFDGAMYNAHVWINGHLLGSRPFGYIGFQFDLTPFVKFDGKNSIAVRLTPEDLSSRWYPGAGIYRNTWLEITADTRVAHWGTFVTTPVVTETSADVNVESKITHSGDSQVERTVQTTLLDSAGKQVAETSSPISIYPGETVTVSHNLQVANPKRWDPATPVLYTAVTRILEGKKEVDLTKNSFGIRSVEYKPLAYSEVTAEHPGWNILGSETSSCVSSRGVYHLPIEKYEKHSSQQVTSYDLIGPPWAYPPDIEFHYLKENPHCKF